MEQAAVERPRQEPSPEWVAERERLEKAIPETFYARAEQQGYLNGKGRLNAKGQAAAVEFVIGMANALHMVGHSHGQWLINQCFLVSVRGFEDRFPRVAK